MNDRPGKRTLTSTLPSASRREAPELAIGKTSAAAAAHPAPPKRVADTDGKALPNAVIKVMAYSKGKLIGEPWGAKARWEGPLPQRYTGTRGPHGWTWNNPDAKTVRVGSDLNGQGGKTAEAWAGAQADRIVIYAAALNAVTSDRDAKPNEGALGRGSEERDGAAKTGLAQEPHGHPPGHRAVGAPDGVGELGQERTHARGDARIGEDRDRLVADFERSIGIDEDGDVQTHGPGGTGSAWGRAGKDTRDGGTGPGGTRARLVGDGAGSENGGHGGTRHGSRDGGKEGAEDGMYGGTGHIGDHGVPSASATALGLVAMPQALQGLVELALILAAGDAAGAGEQLCKRTLGKFASAALARAAIAQEARHWAMEETERVLERIAKSEDRALASVWSKLSAAEQSRVRRVIYWELQRKYFRGYLEAAKRAKLEAKAALRGAPSSEQLKHAEMAEEAALAPPIAGRLPQNHEYAGRQFPIDLLPPPFRQQGLRFTEAGHPDFSPFAKTLPNGKKSVEIEYTGSRQSDFAAANAAAGFKTTPPEYRWHHHEDGKTMILVPADLHDVVKHTGGVAAAKHAWGLDYGN